VYHGIIFAGCDLSLEKEKRSSSRAREVLMVLKVNIIPPTNAQCNGRRVDTA
jgi:hypothetical protein